MVGGACAVSKLQISFGPRKPNRRARPLKARRSRLDKAQVLRQSGFPGPARPGRKAARIISSHRGRERMYPGLHAVARADQPAIIMAGSGETVTYRELEARSNRLAISCARSASSGAT